MKSKIRKRSHVDRLIAKIILEELASDIEWDQLFAESHDLLANMAAEVMPGYKAGDVNN